MIDGPLLDIVIDRLTSAGLIPSAEDLVIAACEGPDALHKALGGTSPVRPATAPNQAAEPTEPLGA